MKSEKQCQDDSPGKLFYSHFSSTLVPQEKNYLIKTTSHPSVCNSIYCGFTSTYCMLNTATGGKCLRQVPPSSSSKLSSVWVKERQLVTCLQVGSGKPASKERWPLTPQVFVNVAEWKWQRFTITETRVQVLALSKECN